MIPFVFSGQACAAGGSCAVATLSAPAWAGIAVFAGVVFLGAKLIDAKPSSDSTAVEKSG